MFSKKATKIDEIFTVYLTSTKGQKFCSEYLGQNFSNFFVHILGNGTTSYFRFEIYWPLLNGKLTVKISSIFVVFLENMNLKKQILWFYFPNIHNLYSIDDKVEVF